MGMMDFCILDKERVTSDDRVGGGINYASHEFFFTKNGTVPKDIMGPLYPTIAVHSQNEEYLTSFLNIKLLFMVQVNFGQRPFAFDLKEFEALERMKQQMMIEKILLPANVCHGEVDMNLFSLRNLKLLAFL